MKTRLAIANLATALSTMTAVRIQELQTEDPNFYRMLDQTFGTAGLTGRPLEEVNWQQVAGVLRQTAEISVSYAGKITEILEDTSQNYEDDAIAERISTMFGDKDVDVAKLRSQAPIFAHLDEKNSASIQLIVRNNRERVLQALDSYDAGVFSKSRSDAKKTG